MSGALARAGLRGHARRLGATALAIVLGVAFVATVVIGVSSVGRGVTDVVAGGLAERDLVVTADREPLTQGMREDLTALTEVEVVDTGARLYGERGGSFAFLVTTPRGPGLQVIDGVLPAAGQEGVALSSTTAELSGLQVGDTLEFTAYPSEGEQAGPARLPVIGVVDLGPDPVLTGQDVVIGDLSTLLALDPALTLGDVLLDVTDGVDPAVALDAVEAVTSGALVRTGEAEATARVAGATGETDVIGGVLLGFGGVALATSAIVIANTFVIVLAQRTRELALLRALGATRRQVRRTVLLEAALLGAVASAVGVAAGFGVAALGLWVLRSVDLGVPVPVPMGLDVPVTALVLSWLTGVVVTMGAAWWPSRAAVRVSPLAALRPSDAPVVGSRAGRVRLAGGGLLLAAGVCALVAAATARLVAVGVLGGVLSFVGVLLLGVVVVPAAVELLGRPLRRTGVPGRLAVDHAVSNPGRAAATSAALLVGVTLITMTAVGAASATRTAEVEIAQANPVDVLALADATYPGGAVEGGLTGVLPGVLDAGAADGLLALPSVQAGAPLTGSSVVVTGPGQDEAFDEIVLGVDPAVAAQVVRDPGPVATLAPDTLGASPEWLAGRGLAPGDEVTLAGPGGETSVSVVEFGLGRGWVTTADVVEVIDPGAEVTGVALRLSDDADVGQVLTEVRTLVEGQVSFVDGSAAQRESLTQVLDILVLVTTALLGVAVVIAVVGIANTLSLSVLERSREHALLRALGLTRRQLRATLAWEGVLLALVSTVLGVGLGTGYAVLGVQAVLPEDVAVIPALPWAGLGAVLGLAVAAGLLASVLPARRAARTAPAAGLATV